MVCLLCALLVLLALQELDTLSPWLQRGQLTYTAPLYAFSSALGRSTAAAAAAAGSSASGSNSLSVETAQWLLEEPNRVTTANTAASASLASRLTLVVNPHVNKALSFVVPNAWPSGCSAQAAAPSNEAPKGVGSNAAETSSGSTTGATSTTSTSEVISSSASTTGASPTVTKNECHAALLFHHGQTSSTSAMSSSFKWSVDATTGQLRGFLPPLDTAAFVGTQSAENGACAPGEEGKDFTISPQASRPNSDGPKL